MKPYGFEAMANKGCSYFACCWDGNMDMARLRNSNTSKELRGRNMRHYKKIQRNFNKKICKGDQE